MGHWRFLYSAPLARPSSLAPVVVASLGFGSPRRLGSALHAIVPVILLVVSCRDGLIWLCGFGANVKRGCLLLTWNGPGNWKLQLMERHERQSLDFPPRRNLQAPSV
jgi:hypothetical protein